MTGGTASMSKGSFEDGDGDSHGGYGGRDLQMEIDDARRQAAQTWQNYFRMRRK